MLAKGGAEREGGGMPFAYAGGAGAQPAGDMTGNGFNGLYSTPAREGVTKGNKVCKALYQKERKLVRSFNLKKTVKKESGSSRSATFYS